jgi:Ferrochelatase
MPPDMNVASTSDPCGSLVSFTRRPARLLQHYRPFSRKHQLVPRVHAAVSEWSPSSEDDRPIAASLDPPPAMVDRVGVLLLNLGGPETLEDVQPFLYNLFADPDIIRLPAPVQFLQPLIAQLISALRTPKSREGYEAIGGGSPLRRITEEQAAALNKALTRKGLPAHTYVAMRYWKPFTGEIVLPGISFLDVQA